MGVWKDKDELRALRQNDVCFSPRRPASEYAADVAEWQRAIKRSLDWYKYVDV